MPLRFSVWQPFHFSNISMKILPSVSELALEFRASSRQFKLAALHWERNMNGKYKNKSARRFSLLHIPFSLLTLRDHQSSGTRSRFESEMLNTVAGGAGKHHCSFQHLVNIRTPFSRTCH
jgi:hypothetical protein